VQSRVVASGPVGEVNPNPERDAKQAVRVTPSWAHDGLNSCNVLRRSTNHDDESHDPQPATRNPRRFRSDVAALLVVG